MPESQIVQLTTVHPRGDTRIFYREVRSLSGWSGAALTLVVADGKGCMPHLVDGTAVPVCDIGVPPGGRVGRAIIGSWRAIGAIRAIAPEVVHFHDPELIPLGLLLKGMGYKVIYDVHEDVPKQILNKYWIPRILRRAAAWTMSALEQLASWRFDAIVSATPFIATKFSNDKSIVVQNFPVISELTFEDALPYYERRNSFVYVGALSESRGLRELVRAVELLASESHISLELAGRFQPSALEADLRSLPGWKSVKYHGWATRQEVARMLGSVRAGLVVLHPKPNYLDAYAVKMFEYMAAGLPVIASDFPLWRKIVGDAGCGILVNPLDANQIGDAMRWVIDNPTCALEMGQRGRQAVEELYNWEAEGRKLLDLYDGLRAAR